MLKLDEPKRHSNLSSHSKQSGLALASFICINCNTEMNNKMSLTRPLIKPVLRQLNGFPALEGSFIFAVEVEVGAVVVVPKAPKSESASSEAEPLVGGGKNR